MTRKNLAFTELLAASMLVGFAGMLTLVNTTKLISDEITESMRAQQSFLLILVYFVMALFLSASWLQGFIARSIFTLPTLTILLLN